MVIAGDVARAAGAGAHPGRGLDHGTDHFRMLTHAEVVVGAPDDDVFRTLRRMPHRVRKTSSNALKIGEYSITPFGPEAGQRLGEIAVIVYVRAVFGIGHRHVFWRLSPAFNVGWNYRGTLLEAFKGICRGH